MVFQNCIDINKLKLLAQTMEANRNQIIFWFQSNCCDCVFSSPASFFKKREKCSLCFRVMHFVHQFLKTSFLLELRRLCVLVVAIYFEVIFLESMVKMVLRSGQLKIRLQNEKKIN